MQRLTFGGSNRYPVWSRDGRWVAFQSDRDGDRAIFRQAADGSGTAERLTKPEAYQVMVDLTPMKRDGTAEECTGAYLYLASDELSSFVTGQVIEVNGGLLMP